MKKAIIYVVCLFLFSSAFAQQLSLTDFYFINSYYLNPASAGDDGSTVFIQNRQQWKEITGAPVTSVFTIDTKVPGRNVGVGLNLSIDADNVFRKTNISASYAYYLVFKEKHYLSFGLNLGVVNARIAYEQIETSDWSDPLLFSSNKNAYGFTADAGLNYRLNNFQLGFSAYQLPGTKLSFNGNLGDPSVNYQLVQHFWGVLKYKFDLLKNNLHVSPEIQARSAVGLPLQLDAGINVDVMNVMMARIGYRHNSSVYMGVAFNVYDDLIIGCAYDYSIGEIANFSGATYELILGYKIGRTRESSAADYEYKKDNKIIKRNIQEQSQDIDRIEHESQKMQNEIEANQQYITELKEEIESLKERAALSDEDLNLLNEIKENYEVGEDELNKRIENGVDNNSIDTTNQEQNSDLIDDENTNAINEGTETIINDAKVDDNSSKAKYCVVVGAYRDIELAKKGQQILRREINLETSLIMESSGYFYFICSDFFDSPEGVVLEKERLQKLGVENYIVGKPWTYFSESEN
jgi:type IX secretion system PorP/SprF family membrane protein